MLGWIVSCRWLAAFVAAVCQNCSYHFTKNFSKICRKSPPNTKTLPLTTFFVTHHHIDGFELIEVSSIPCQGSIGSVESSTLEREGSIAGNTAENGNCSEKYSRYELQISALERFPNHHKRKSLHRNKEESLPKPHKGPQCHSWVPKLQTFL